MQVDRMVTKPFRKMNPKDIVKYICTSDMDSVRRIFKKVYNTEIKTYIQVEEEATLDIGNNIPIPCGILYLKDKRHYAIGVATQPGSVDIDSTYQVTIPVQIKYTLWGPRQREPWQYLQILKSINWRIDFYKTPRYMKRNEIALFERSRWMIFAFWGEDLDKLIQLELELMTKLMRIDSRKGGSMKTDIPKLYGLKNLKELRVDITNQYKRTKFSFNAIEEEFLQKVDIADHIKYVLIETMN